MVSALTVMSGFETAWAAPVSAATATLRTAAASDIVDVHYYRRHRRNEAIVLGIVAGLISAAIANRYYEDYGDYYDYPSYGYYGYPSYGYYGGGHYRGHYHGGHHLQGAHVGHHHHH
jgi:hypothetical protein